MYQGLLIRDTLLEAVLEDNDSSLPLLICVKYTTD